MCIVIVEDEHTIRAELKTLLTREGYEAQVVERFDHAAEEVLEKDPHLVLLDVHLPFVSGYEVAKKIRRSSDVPIIMVTIDNTEADELRSMELGCDDFLTKPYNAKILLARIRAILARVYHKKNVLSYAGVSLDLDARTLTCDGQSVELKKNEFLLLSLLFDHAPNPVTREEMMRALWQTDEFVDENTLSVNINRLRATLAEVGLDGFVKTRRGMGYYLKEER